MSNIEKSAPQDELTQEELTQEEELSDDALVGVSGGYGRGGGPIYIPKPKF